VAVVNEIVVSLQKEYIPHDKARHYSVCEEQLLADAASLQVLARPTEARVGHF